MEELRKGSHKCVSLCMYFILYQPHHFRLSSPSTLIFCSPFQILESLSRQPLLTPYKWTVSSDSECRQCCDVPSDERWYRSMDRIIQGAKFNNPLNPIVSIKRRRKRSILLLPHIPTRPVRKNRHQHLYLPLNMPPLLPSRTALSGLRHSGRLISASTQRLSGRSLFPDTLLKGSHVTASGHGNAQPRTPFSGSSVRTPDGNPSTARVSAMSYKGSPSQADLGPPLPVLDWADSTHEWGEPFQTPPSAAPTTHRDQSSKATTPLIHDSHNTHLDSQDSVIPSSHKSRLSSTAASSKGDQSFIPTGTAVPESSEKSRGFKRHGTRIFRDLNEKYPPYQSR
jgi:hypothetical protein